MSVIVNQQAGGAWGRGTLRIEVPAALTQDPGPGIRGALGVAVAGAGGRLFQNALAAYSRYTGIAGGFQQAVTTGAATVTASVWNTHPLFVLREFDTRAHLITAKQGPYLHFFGRRGWVRVRQVQHPGTTGLNALTPLLARETARFEADLTAALAEVLTRG